MAATTETKSETLSVKITPETLSALRDAAESDGRSVKRNVRPEMMAHFRASIAAHYRLGELLAQ